MYFLQVVKDDKIGPAVAYPVVVNEADSFTTLMKIKEQAEKYAKFLSAMCTHPVRFYPKGQEGSAIVVHMFDEELNSKQ